MKPRGRAWGLRLLLSFGGWLAACSTVPACVAGRADTSEQLAAGPPGESPLPPGVSGYPASERQVGVGYALWHQNDQWQHGTHKV